MIRRPPRSTRTDTLFPYTTLFRACQMAMLGCWAAGDFEPDYDPNHKPPRCIDDVPLAAQGDMLTRAALEFCLADAFHPRSEEHTSELQSLMRISYAVFCLKKKQNKGRECLACENGRCNDQHT